MNPAGTPVLGSKLPEARLMAAAYGLLDQGLTPALPKDFPSFAGFQLTDYLTISDKIAWWSEKSLMGLSYTSVTEDMFVILGTHTFDQWLKDFTAIPRSWVTLDGFSCNVETGFGTVYGEISLANMQCSLRSYVRGLNESKRRLRIVAHSLGAAVGGLVAADHVNPHLSLFAMPLFSDIKLSRYIAAKADPDSLVAHNVRDIVPAAPPFPLYQSVLPEAWFNSDVLGIGGTDEERHTMSTYVKACAS